MNDECISVPYVQQKRETRSKATGAVTFNLPPYDLPPGRSSAQKTTIQLWRCPNIGASVVTTWLLRTIV